MTKEKALAVSEVIPEHRRGPFDLEKAKAGHSVCTADGRPVEVRFFNGRGEIPIYGYVGNSETVSNWNLNGGFWKVGASPNDLRLVLPDCPPHGPNAHNPDALTPQQVETHLGWSKPEHVPPLCWLRGTTGDHLVVYVGRCGVSTNAMRLTWKDLEIQPWEYSTDRVTWKPCTISE